MVRSFHFLLSFVIGALLGLSSASAAETYADYVKEKNRINAGGSEAAIHFFHQKYNESSYVIINKKSKSASFFSEKGTLLEKSTVQTYPGDELNRGGAGIYSYAGAKGSFHYGKAEKDLSVHALFVGDLRISPGTAIYVLPESEDHRFRLRNHKITFNAARVLRNRPLYNYSPLNKEIRHSEFSVDYTDAFIKKYVRTLQEEKATLMALLNLENDEYNMLAEFAFGVLSPETQFGTNWKYRLKQNIPVVVSIFKGNGLDTDQNSRGPTQIKKIPPVIVEKYNIDKGDLKRPENAAVATLAFAADLLKEVRNMANLHPLISEETLQDYIYYLYQGRRYEIKDGTATPEKNQSIQKIKEAIGHLTIEE